MEIMRLHWEEYEAAISAGVKPAQSYREQEWLS